MRFVQHCVAALSLAMCVHSPGFGYEYAGCGCCNDGPEFAGGDCCDCFDPCMECCDCWDDCDRMLGFLPSDHCFDDFISPLSNPFFFADPRSLTEARGIFIENSLPGFIGGVDVQVFAAQVRGRVSDRWSIIAPRLGYLRDSDSDGPGGFMAAPVGVKYNFARNVETQFLATVGATYFIPAGSGPFFGQSDGSAHLFLTAGKEIFDYGHWLSASGFRLPLNTNWGTQFWYWSNQWDYEIADGWYPLFGINWFHWMRSAGAAAGGAGAPVTGIDLVDVPAFGVAGTNVVTSVVGLRLKPNPHVELGTGFEFPLTQRTDILRNRLYVDAIIRY